jgi:hypothetical protein
MLSERLLQLLTAYVDGELSSRQHKAVLRHLRSSAEARALLKKLQEDAARLQQLTAQVVGQDLAQRVLGRIGDQVVRPVRISAPQVPSPVPRGFGLATAAAVLLAAGFGSYYYLRVVSEKESPRAGVPSGRDLVVINNGPEERIAPRDEPKKTDTAPALHEAEKNKPEKPHSPIVVEKKPSTLPPESPTPGVLGSEAVPEDHFQVAETKLAMHVASRDLVDETPRLNLLKRLSSDQAQHIDLYCKQTRSALERMEKAFSAESIRFVWAPDAADAYVLGKKSETDYVLFTENVKPSEVLSVLRTVAEEDRKQEMKRKGHPVFGELFVNGITKDDQKLLAKVLGVDPVAQQISKPATPLGTDILKPITARTADEVSHSLQGKGRVPRPQPGKPALKTPERLVVVGTCNPIHPRPHSEQVKGFLESRKERAADTFQMLLILRRQR